MPPEATEPIPGFADKDLLETVTENYGTGADSDLPSDLRFFLNVVQLVGKRLKTVEDPSRSDPAVFFLLPNGPQLRDHLRLKSEPMLNNGVIPVAGRFWFVAQVVVKGEALSVDDWSSDASVFEFADKLGVGTAPAVFVDTRTNPPEARCYQSGLNKPNDVKVFPMGAAAINIETVLSAVDRAHDQFLKTPSIQSSSLTVWRKASKHWVRENAEKRIQDVLRIGLGSRFPAMVVRSEKPLASGRIDLEVQEPLGQGTVVRHAVLELKVLRRFRSTGRTVPNSKNTKAIEDGVLQVSSYRKESDAKAAALCCFDLREKYTDQECFVPVKRSAGARRVRLKAWHLFGSAKEFRKIFG